MATDALYPPIIEGTIPAFYGDEIIVPYSMNKTVSSESVIGFSLKIKTVQNNKFLGTVTSEVGINEDEAHFTLNLDELKLNVGQYYKVQMAYLSAGIEKNDPPVVGYYSTAGVVKYTSKPTVLIDGLDAKVRNAHAYSYIGRYKQTED